MNEAPTVRSAKCAYGATLIGRAAIAAGALCWATAAFAGGIPSYTEQAAPPPAAQCEPDTPAYHAIRGCSALLGSPDTDPETRVRIFNMRGYAWLKEDEPVAAVSDFSRAIKLDETNISALTGRARAHEQLQQYSEATADWTRLVKLNPGNPEFYRQRANSYHLQGKYELAVADFTRVLELDEQSLEGHVGRALAYDAMDKLPEALADFESAIKVDARSPAVFQARAEMWDRRKENKKAIADYEQSLRLNSINLKIRQALQRLGVSHPYP